MCVICEMGKIVERLERLAAREVLKNEKENAAKAIAATFLVQAAQASMSGEWGIIGQLIAKAQLAIDEALEQTQCSECGKPGCPRNRDCEETGEDQPN